MPLYYETALLDKPPVVLDIGNAYTKLGFAAEAHPRFIIPTCIKDTVSGTETNVFTQSNEQELYDHLVEFLQRIFFKYLLMTPKDRKIVIVENVLGATKVRDVLAKVLFTHYEVGSISYVPTHLVSLSTLAIDTALVIDMGYKESIAIPVYSGVQVLCAWQAQAFGAELVHNEIRKQLIETGVDASILSESVVEDIKVRTCFVTTRARALQYLSDQKPAPPPDVDYNVKGKYFIKIPGELRETAYEVFFPVDNDRMGLPYNILDAILMCPIDMRKQLANNVFFIGGTSMVMGFVSRMKSELTELLKSDFYKDKLFVETVKFHRAPAKANFTAWLGGSLYGGTDLVQTSALTKEQFAKINHVPDWSNLSDNHCL